MRARVQFIQLKLHTNRQLAMTSLVPQCYKWINLCCPAAWYVAGNKSHDCKQHGDSDKRCRVSWFHAKEHACHQSRKTESTNQTKSNSDYCQPHSLTDH